MISSATNLILAQRLARRSCVDCRERTEESPKVLEKLGLSIAEIESAQLMKGKGCSVCSETGYKGRIALYEVMPIGAELKEMIIYGASGTELKEKAVELGMDTLRIAGVRKMVDGEITMEEVVRVTKAD